MCSLPLEAPSHLPPHPTPLGFHRAPGWVPYAAEQLPTAAAAAAAKSLQSCPTLRNPIDSSPRGSAVTGTLQARTLEWVAISFSNARKWKVKVKSLSRVWLLATPWTAAHQAPPSMGFSRQEYWSGKWGIFWQSLHNPTSVRMWRNGHSLAMVWFVVFFAN